MANDRTVNINIKYNVDTADVQKAAAQSARAQQATDAFRASSHKAGQQSSQAFGQVTKSILTMETELTRLRTQIEISSNPKRIQELSNQYKILKAQIDAAKQSAFGFSQNNKKVEESTKGIVSQFGGLITAVKTFIGFQIARQLVDISLEAAKLSGNVEGIERAFNRAFPNAKQIMFELQRATHGTVSEVELMQRTLQATNLGVSVAPLPKLFEFAAARAKQTGESVDYLVDSIVRGIGRKSALILDNLGISALRLKQELGGVSLQAASVGQVTEVVGRIAQEELTKMGGYAETAATEVDQLTSSWAGLRQEAAKALTDNGGGGLVAILKDYVATFKLGIEAWNKGIPVQELANQKRQEEIALISEASFARHALNGTQEENVKTIEDEIQRLTEELGAFARTRQMYQGRLDDIKKEMDAIAEKRFMSQKEAADFREKIALNKKLRDSNKESIAIDQEILKLLQGRLKALQQINEEEEKEQSGIISRKQAQIEALEEQIKFTNNLNDLTHTVTDAQGNQIQVVGTLIKKLEIARAELADLQRAFSEINLKPLKIKIDDATKGLSDFETTIKRIEAGLKTLAEVSPVPPRQTVARLDTFWTNMGKMWRENWRDLTAASVDFQTNAINSMLELNVQNMQAELSALKAHYQARQQLAGDNARVANELRVRENQETEKLQRQIFDREKEVRRAQAVVDGAGAVVKAFVTAPNVYVAIAQAALIAGTVAAQLRLINKEQPRFAKGVIDLKGPGTETSDSIPARLSKRESVMTAKETKSSKGILTAIRKNELNDKILKHELDNQVLKTLHLTNDGVKMIPNDNSAVVKAIKDIPQTDAIRQAGAVYEAKIYREAKYIRYKRKSLN